MARFNYYKGFIDMSNKSVEAAELLYREFHNFSKVDLKGKIDEMHKIEHSCDMIMHKIVEHLAKEFLPPIEREDIMALIYALDTVTDTVEEVLICTYAVDVDYIKEDALKMCELLIDCTKALNDAVVEFEKFKKSKEIKDLIIKIDHIEEAGDKLYVGTLNKLYSSKNGNDGFDILRWDKIYGRLEASLDSCEIAGNLMESIILKNS